MGSDGYLVDCVCLLQITGDASGFRESDVLFDDTGDTVLSSGVSLIDPLDVIVWEFHGASDGVVSVLSWSSVGFAVWFFGSGFHWFCSCSF